MKKIFHFVSTNILSGLENVVLNISTLVKDYDYTYVSPDGPINEYLDELGIKHVSIKKMTPFNVRKVLKKYNPDIVHGHDVKASVSLAFNHIICKHKCIKIISELHNDDPRMHSLSLRSILYLLSSRYYNKVITVSQSITNNYIFHNYIKYKTIVINNIINPIRIKKKAKCLNISNKKWDCIFIGRLVKQKDPLKFLNIIYKLKQLNNDISAVVVGNGNLYNEMIKLTYQYDLTNNIDYVGFQKNPYYFLNHSKILLIPSIYEGLPLVFLESLTLGVPVISAPVDGLKGLLDNNCGAFASNEEIFIKNINFLLDNENIYNLKVKNAIKRSKKINNINKFIKLYKFIYKN